MVLTLIIGSNFYCILPSQSPKGDSSPRGRAKSVCEFESSSTNGNLKNQRYVYRKTSIRGVIPMEVINFDQISMITGRIMGFFLVLR